MFLASKRGIKTYKLTAGYNGAHTVCTYILVAVGSSGLLKRKQKLSVTFNSDKLGGIDFTKISKMTMYVQCLAGSLDIDFSKKSRM